MRWLLVGLVLIVYLVHQDNWLWSNDTLVLGFLPAGLAYHAAYCVLASITMAILVHYGWPRRLEASVPETPAPGTAPHEAEH
jgi:Protein of unknown function (DUF3311)